MIALLLVDGPLNSRDIDGSTPLLIATLSQQPENVRALLGRNTRPDIADDVGLTPLLVAARDGQVEIARLLLDRGADPARVNRSGEGIEFYLNWHPTSQVSPEGSRAASLGNRPTPEDLARLDAAHAEIRAMTAAR